MSFASTSLAVREDSYSFQVTSPLDPFFFVRVIESTSNCMTFSDFNIHTVDTETIMRMLWLVKKRFDGPTHGMNLIFLNILPKQYGAVLDVEEKKKLTTRHDQIVQAIHDFGFLSGFVVKNAYLDKKRDKFNTMVET